MTTPLDARSPDTHPSAAHSSAARASAHEHVTIADQIADQVASGRLNPSDQVLVSVRDLIDVHRKLASQPLINQAKGVVMAYYAIDDNTAFAVFRRWSQNHNVKLHALAAALLDDVTNHPNRDLSPQDIIEHAVATRFRPPTDNTDHHPSRC